MGYMVVGPNGELHVSNDVRTRLGLKPGDIVPVDVDPIRNTAVLSCGVGPLESRNIQVAGRRTSIRLEPSMWQALETMAKREGLTVNALCTLIKERLDKQREYAAKEPGAKPETAAEKKSTFTSAVRVLVAAYFVRAATELDRQKAEDGSGDPFVGTPFASSESPSLSSVGARKRHTINDLIGMGGTFHRSVSVEEMDEAIRKRAAERYLRR